MNTKLKRMYPHQCRICGKTYYNSRDSKRPGTCCKRCSMIHANISHRLKRHPLRDAAALVDVAEDLLDLPAQMPPTKMPSGIYWEVINVVDSYHKNRRRNGDVV